MMKITCGPIKVKFSTRNTGDCSASFPWTNKEKVTRSRLVAKLNQVGGAGDTLIALMFDFCPLMYITHQRQQTSKHLNPVRPNQAVEDQPLG